MAESKAGVKPDMTTIHKTAAKLTREAWVTRLVDGATNSRNDVPPMPPEEVQKVTNGLSGQPTMSLAADWYIYFWTVLGAHQLTVSDPADILDVGCGWGRILRFFLRDAPIERLAGVDVDGRLVEACRETLPGARFESIEPRGRLPFEDDQFTLIINNSLFSHLSIPQHRHTLAEMVRVLRPGGVMVSTIIGRRHLLTYLSRGEPHSQWASLGDPKEALERFDAGEFVFGRTRDGRMAEYGLAVIPDSWLVRHWSELLDVVTIDHHAPGQSMVLASKPAQTPENG